MLAEIDISPLRQMTDKAGVANTACLIDEAASRFGFFYATGHGIPRETFDALLAASERFFALPEEVKAAISMDRGGTAWRGWFPVEGELTSGLPDLKEGLYLGEDLGPGDPRVQARLPLHGARFAEELGAWSLNCDVDFVDAGLVADAHRRGLKVLVYTVDEVSDGDALAAMGVDGIFTNRPDRFS